MEKEIEVIFGDNMGLFQSHFPHETDLEKVLSVIKNLHNKYGVYQIFVAVNVEGEFELNDM